MLDLECKRDEALSLNTRRPSPSRDGQLDTRLAAERGVKTAYLMKGHSCDDDGDDAGAPPAAKPGPEPNAQKPH